MAKKTELKIANVLNDIYIKSKSKISFSLNEMRDHHNIGVGIWNILKNEKLIKKIDTGKYVYIGNSPTYELVKIIYEKYIEYNTLIMRDSVNKRSKEFTLFGEKIPNYNKKNKEIDNKQKVRFLNDNDLIDMLFKRYDELNNQIILLSKELKNLNTAMYTIKDSQDRAINKLYESSENPKKSFISKLFS